MHPFNAVHVSGKGRMVQIIRKLALPFTHKLYLRSARFTPLVRIHHI
jgi:hypothetical protein